MEKNADSVTYYHAGGLESRITLKKSIFKSYCQVSIQKQKNEGFHKEFDFPSIHFIFPKISKALCMFENNCYQELV